MCILYLVFPNGTAATQEMGQGCSVYMTACKRSAERLVGIKLAACMAAWKKKDSKDDSGGVGLPYLLRYLNDENSGLEDVLEESNPGELGVPAFA